MLFTFIVAASAFAGFTPLSTPRGGARTLAPRAHAEARPLALLPAHACAALRLRAENRRAAAASSYCA